MKKLLVLLWATLIGTIFLLFIIDLFPSFSVYFNKIISQDKRFLHAMFLVFSLSIFAFVPYLEIVYLLDFKIKRLKQEEKDRLYPLLKEVLDKSNKIYNTHYTIDKMFIRMIRDEDTNAFATGRSIVAVHTGLLSLNDEEIKAILAHEIGHLHNKDSFLNLALWFVLLPYKVFMKCYMIVCYIFNVVVKIFCLVPGVGIFVAVLSYFIALVSYLFVTFDYIINTVYNFLYLLASRNDEYNADKFSASLGYHLALVSSLEKLDDEPQISRFRIVAWFKEFWHTHPETIKRIKALQQYTTDKR